MASTFVDFDPQPTWFSILYNVTCRRTVPECLPIFSRRSIPSPTCPFSIRQNRPRRSNTDRHAPHRHTGDGTTNTPAGTDNNKCHFADDMTIDAPGPDTFPFLSVRESPSINERLHVSEQVDRSIGRSYAGKVETFNRLLGVHERRYIGWIL